MTTPSVVSVVNPPGHDAYAYSNSGSYGSPVWTEIGVLKDVTLGDAVTLYKAAIRAKRPFDTYVPTSRDMNPKFKVAWIPTDDFIVAVLDAVANGTGLDLIFLDGPIATAGSQGPRADWVFEGTPMNQNLADGQEVDLSLKPGLTANVPSWYVAA